MTCLTKPPTVGPKSGVTHSECLPLRSMATDFSAIFVKFFYEKICFSRKIEFLFSTNVKYIEMILFLFYLIPYLVEKYIFANFGSSFFSFAGSDQRVASS